MARRVDSISKLADALNISRSTVYRWQQENWGLEELFDEEAGGWDPDEVRLWQQDMKRARRKVLRPAFEVGDDVGDPGDGDRDWGTVYRKAKAVLATLQAQKLQGSMIDRESMEQGFAMRVAELTTALDSLASQLAPRLAPMTRESEIQALLREAFQTLRDHFARDDE